MTMNLNKIVLTKILDIMPENLKPEIVYKSLP